LSAKLLLMLPAALFFVLGATLEVRFVRSRKIGAVMMGLFFDGLGIWWILKVLDAPAPTQRIALIAALACGAIGLVADALGVGGSGGQSGTR